MAPGVLLERHHAERGDRLVKQLGGFVASTEQRRASKVALGLPDRVVWVLGWQLWWECKRTIDPAPTTPHQRAWFLRSWEHRAPAVVGDEVALQAVLESCLPLCSQGRWREAQQLAEGLCSAWLVVPRPKPRTSRSKRFSPARPLG